MKRKSIYSLIILVALVALGLSGFFNKDSSLSERKVIWKHNLETKGIIRSANLYAKEDLIYVSSYYGPFLLEIDSSSGQIKREFKVGEGIRSSDLTDKIFYYNTMDRYDIKNNYIHALDISTGVEKWTQKIENPEEEYVPLSLKADVGKVYLNEGFRKVHALDSENGKKLWSFGIELSTEKVINESPLISTGKSVVILGFDDGIVYALDSESGKELWKFDTDHPRHPRPEEILVTNKIVYVASYSTTGDTVYALDTETGQIEWQFSTDGNPNTSMTSHEDILFVAKAHGYLHAVDGRSGKELWKFKTDDFPSNLVVSGNRIYFGKTEYREPFPAGGHIYAVDTKNGRQIWDYETQGTISGVVATNGIGYFSIGNGEMIAVK
ncbi:MAG: PQQ-binding-like beta-propeller repeat protein [Candidatus Levybacteria bacterium]|nr:PQQ-binding-like beta-propeller repeat protein [Candidatus Levybacteria bacterium]